MKTFWRHLALVAGSATNPTLDVTTFKLVLPVIAEVKFYAPAVAIGVKIDTPKQRVLPAQGTDDPNDMIRGVGALLTLPVDYVVEGPPYYVTITTANFDTNPQTCELGLVLAPEEQSVVDLLQQILAALGKAPSQAEGAPRAAMERVSVGERKAG